MMNQFKTIAAPFRSRNPALVFTATALSHFGDWFYMVAMAKISYDAGGVMGVTAATIARYAPAVFLPPIAGALADRLPPKSVMIAADLVRAVLMAALGWIAAVDGGNPMLIAALVFAASAAGAAFRPARMSLMPRLAKADELQALNAADGSVSTLALMVAPALGGVGLALTSAGWLFLLDSASFLASALILGWIRVQPLERTDSVKVPPRLSPIAALRRTVNSTSDFVPTVLTYTASHFAVGATWVILPVFAMQAEGAQDAWIGFLTSAVGVGSVAGMIFGGSLGSRSAADRLRLAYVAILAFGGATAIVGYLPGLPLLTAGLAAMGLFANLAEAPFWTHWQRSIAPELHGRAFGWIDGISTGGMLLGSACAGYVTQAHGVAVGSGTAGLVVVAVVIAALASSRLVQESTVAQVEAPCDGSV